MNNNVAPQKYTHISVEDLWAKVFESEYAYVRLPKTVYKQVIRRLSKVKYQYVKKSGGIDPGRLRSLVEEQDANSVKLRLWLDTPQEKAKIPIQILECKPLDDARNTHTDFAGLEEELDDLGNPFGEEENYYE